jgi:hypothetical protein
LEKRAEQALPGSEGNGEKGKRDREQGGEMAQTMNTNMNK